MKFGYAILYVKDVAASMAFYEKAFGVTRIFLHESGQYGELDTGATKLCFANLETAKPEGLDLQTTDMKKAAPPFEVAFVTDEIESAYKRAIDSGCAKVLPPTEKPWGQTVSYVRDLNGFLIEICTSVK